MDRAKWSVEKTKQNICHHHQKRKENPKNTPSKKSQQQQQKNNQQTKGKLGNYNPQVNTGELKEHFEFLPQGKFL